MIFISSTTSAQRSRTSFRWLEQMALAAACLLSVACEGSWGPWQAVAIGTDDAEEFRYSGGPVAIAANRAAFAATLSDGRQVVDIFHRPSTDASWRFLQRLTKRSANPEPRFAGGLAMNGDDLVIGSGHYYESTILGPDERIGYVDHYRFSSGLYRFVRTLVPIRSSGTINRDNRFGDSIDVSGNVVVVGANTYQGLGAAFVFDLSTGAQTGFMHETEFRYRAEPRFGHVVRVSGSTIAIGEPRFCMGSGVERPCRGRVLIYERQATSWTLVDEIESPVRVTGDPGLFTDNFGTALALRGRWLVVANSDTAAGGPKLWTFRRNPFCARPTPPTSCWQHVASMALVGGIDRDGLAYDGATLVQAGRFGGVDADTGASTGIARIYDRVGTRFELEGEVVFPNSKYARRVDLYGKSFIVSTEEASAGMVLFNRSE